MPEKKRILPERLKSALTDLGIVTLYEALDWVDEIIAKLFPGADIPEEYIDEVANLIAFSILAGAPLVYKEIFGENLEKEEWLRRIKNYGRAALVEAGEIPPLVDFIPAYHLAWLQTYYPEATTRIKQLYKWMKKKPEEEEV